MEVKRTKSGGSGSKKDDNDKSRSSKKTAGSISQLKKKMTKSFATLENKIQELEKEDSDVTESDSDEEASHFQFEETGFQMTQIEEDCLIQGVRHKEALQDVPGVLEEATVLQQEFEKRNANVPFKQKHGKKIELDLKNVMLLDSQSTVDLFCNPKFVRNTKRSSNKMRLKSNGGTMMVGHEATMKGCTMLMCGSAKMP
jgi:hypothetical protein